MAQRSVESVRTSVRKERKRTELVNSQSRAKLMACGRSPQHSVVGAACLPQSHLMHTPSAGAVTKVNHSRRERRVNIDVNQDTDPRECISKHYTRRDILLRLVRKEVNGPRSGVLC